MDITPITWEVVEYDGNSTAPKRIKRLHDSVVFSIGDFVTNGTKMRGKIEKFNFCFKGNDVFVYTDWSSIGMNLDSLQHKTLLPSKYQINDEINLNQFFRYGVVIAVHFTISKIKYDVEIDLGSGKKTRIYNLDEVLLSKSTYCKI